MTGIKLISVNVRDGMSYKAMQLSEWKDCTSCGHFGKCNFVCDLFGANTLSDKKYETCGEYR